MFKTLMKYSLLVYALAYSWTSYGLINSSSEENQSTRELILGGILKGALENMHYAKLKVEDDISQKAFKLFIERMDYGKQFLIQPDVKSLEKYMFKMDDLMTSGKLEVVEVAYDILLKRQKYVKELIFKRLKQPFNLKKSKGMLETDPEKRKYVSNLEDLGKLWEKLLTWDVLSKYADFQQEQEDLKKNKKKDKDKKAKKEEKKEKKKILSKKELEKKARDAVAKSYTRFFNRMDRERRADRLDKFYNSITRVFDPHTHYLIPDEKEDFDIDMSGKLEGIGALLREEGSFIKVERIIPGSASWKGKQLKAGDVIMKVGQGEDDAVSVVDMSLRDAVKLIRGKKGTEVRLTVKKADGLMKVIPIIRDVVEIEESYVKSSVIEHKELNHKFGYINIPKFYRDFNDSRGRNCTDDTRNAIQALKKKNIQALILDLRNNGGGALDDARMISGLFIKKGPIVQVKNHTGAIEILRDKNPEVAFDKPVVVLINKFSASASEIVAAALQDYRRAIIVGGQHSHGKGTVQAVLDLDGYVPPMARAYSPFGALKITIQKFYRVTGGSTQYKGVTPDVILPDPYEYLESGERYLDYSLSWGKVGAVKFNTWKPSPFNVVETVKRASEKRVKKNPKFKKITESINWYKKRRKESTRELSIGAFLKERDLVKKKAEELKIDNLNKKIEIQALKKYTRDEDKEKFKEFSETLKKDPYLEESLFILNDLLNKDFGKVKSAGYGKERRKKERIDT
jgi:carboxyl-terminal processing protease